jgi:hypothetical protein
MPAQNRDRRWSNLDDSFMARGLCSTFPFFDARGYAETDVGYDQASGGSMWFKEDRPSASAKMLTVQAKSICRRCPEETACLAYALAGRVEHGVWGGTTPKQRKALRREARITEVAAVG